MIASPPPIARKKFRVFRMRTHSENSLSLVSGISEWTRSLKTKLVVCCKHSFLSFSVITSKTSQSFNLSNLKSHRKSTQCDLVYPDIIILGLSISSGSNSTTYSKFTLLPIHARNWNIYIFSPVFHFSFRSISPTLTADQNEVESIKIDPKFS